MSLLDCNGHIFGCGQISKYFHSDVVILFDDAPQPKHAMMRAQGTGLGELAKAIQLLDYNGHGTSFLSHWDSPIVKSATIS